MKCKNLHLLLFSYFAIVSCEDTFRADSTSLRDPAELKYIEITNAREGAAVVTVAPTVQTGGLIPEFEIMSITKGDGTPLDQSYLQQVSIGKSTSGNSAVDPDLGLVDKHGNPLDSVSTINSASNGVISIASGHNFTVGDYYFTIKVTTSAEGKEYSTVFEKAFHLHIAPLLPTNLVFSPKNQNLVYGDVNSKTTAPLLPNANPDVSFELANFPDKLVIDKKTGVISISPTYSYSDYDTLAPVVKVVSNISGEVVTFENRLITIITDKPEEMPVETIYTFYPTLNVNAAYPSGGTGYTVQTDLPGVATRIWGNRTNSVASYLSAPPERPVANTGQTIIETCTFSSSAVTRPVSTWMVTTTQDLTPFQYGYKLSFNYYYMPAYQTYMSDGRTPTDLEVYISTDYTGGDIQDAEGNWINGTWSKVNQNIRCQRSEGVNGSNSIGAPWGAEFTGTPYPGDQRGADPDLRKKPGTTFYGKWIKCSYDISSTQQSKTFTVAFKVASYFEGVLLNNSTAPGRGGSYFISDFNYKAVEH